MIRRIDLHIWLNLKKKIMFFLPIIFLALAGLACNFPKLRTPAKALRAAEYTTQPTQQAVSQFIDGAASLNHIAGSGDTSGAEVILHWQGTLPGDPTTNGAPNLLGIGGQAMNAEEIDQLAAWSLRVYNRMAEARY